MFSRCWKPYKNAVNAPKSSAAFPLRTDDVVAFIGGADMSAAQHTGHLESLLAAKFPTARFRNLLVHCYAKVDDGRVVEILRTRLDDLTTYRAAVARAALG